MKTAQASFDKFCMASSIEFDWSTPALVTTDRLQQWAYYCLANEPGFPQLHVNTIRHVYLPALTKYLQRKNFTLEPDARRLVLRQISNMVREGTVPSSSLPGEVGSAPLTVACVNHIIASVPAGVADKVEMSALIALGIKTGGRAGSLHNVDWKDIKIVAVDGNYVQIRCTFTHMKKVGTGVQMRHHTVTVEGLTTDESGSSLAFHLLQLVRERLGEENATLNDLGRLTGLIFPSSYAHYAARLRVYCTHAGFPESLKLTLHSFRAGFLTTAMLTNADQNKSLAETWTAAALVCAWNLSTSSSQFKYVKAAFQRCIVASRVLHGGPPPGVDTARFGEGVRLCVRLRCACWCGLVFEFVCFCV